MRHMHTQCCHFFYLTDINSSIIKFLFIPIILGEIIYDADSLSMWNHVELKGKWDHTVPIFLLLKIG